jgi:DNA polymerase I-like protein with 3'-5' exonuclease and polymerase domains
MRGLVRPPCGAAIAYLDYQSEEFAIAAALSGDEKMLAAYLGGDPYLGVGIAMGIAPGGATKSSHGAIREMCKVIVLGLGYGMEKFGLSRRLGISESDAADLLLRHRRAFPVFWRWSEGGVAFAKAQRKIVTPFGWQMHVPRNVNPRALLNWPMQSLGADLLRLVATALVDEGVKVAALIHDAVLVEGSAKEFDGLVEHACATMRRASELVVGVPLRVDIGSDDEPHLFRYPARFRDKREGGMYDTARRLLLEAERLSA